MYPAHRIYNQGLGREGIRQHIPVKESAPKSPCIVQICVHFYGGVIHKGSWGTSCSRTWAYLEADIVGLEA